MVRMLHLAVGTACIGLTSWLVARVIIRRRFQKTGGAEKVEVRLRAISIEEVARHDTPDDCWLIIDGYIYDVSSFALNHPGGPDLIHALAGSDATYEFLQVHPPNYTSEYLGPPIGFWQPCNTRLEKLKESKSFSELRKELRTGVLTVTGGFGAMVQRYMREVEVLKEEDYRSCVELANHPQDLFGNHDVLCLSRPDVVQWVYRNSMIGCHIVGTSTFNTTRISQEEYGISDPALIYEMAKRSASIAFQAKQGLPGRFVGGQIGPTTRTACVATDVDDASIRTVTFDELAAAYGDLVQGLVDGGVEVLMIDCAFDSLNVKAAIYAIQHTFVKTGVRLPVFVSMSLVDDSGRTLSGQSIEAFYATIRHARAMTVGFNCGAGPEQMKRYILRMSNIAECFTHAYPNAGLPNALGMYDLEPEPMAEQVSEFAKDKLSNVVGGCCGAGPEHLSCIKGRTSSLTSVRLPSASNNMGHFEASLYDGVSLPERRPRFLLSGSEALAWLSRAGMRAAVEEGEAAAGGVKMLACVVDLRAGLDSQSIAAVREACADEDACIIGLSIKSRGEAENAGVEKLFHSIQGEPELSIKPLLIQVCNPLAPKSQALICRILKCLQGRSLVDLGRLPRDPYHLSFFVREIYFLGASIMIEHPESDDAVRCAYEFAESVGLLPDEVVFSSSRPPRPPPTSTTSDHMCALMVHDGSPSLPPAPMGARLNDWAAAVARVYCMVNGEAPEGGAVDVIVCPFVRGKGHARWMEGALCAVRGEGGSSSLGVVDGRRASGGDEGGDGGDGGAEGACRRLRRCVEVGVEDGADEAMRVCLESLSVETIVSDTLMNSMKKVSDDYTSGRTSLPQVLKSSRVLKRLVKRLQGLAGNEAGDKNATSDNKKEIIVLATVKGDVHDLGKTIVGILLRCSGYTVVDLGRNVEHQQIVDACLADGGASLVGLSGMISPSLKRMVECVELLKENNVSCPVLIGGSATSAAFCALMLDTIEYSYGAFRIGDGPKAVLAAHTLIRAGVEGRESWCKEMREGYAELRARMQEGNERANARLLGLKDARNKGKQSRIEIFPPGWQPHPVPDALRSVREVAYSLDELLPFVNWTFFYSVFGLRGRPPHHVYPALLDDPNTGKEAQKLKKDLHKLIESLRADGRLSSGIVVRGVVGVLGARAEGDDIVVSRPCEEGAGQEGLDAGVRVDAFVLRCLRQQEGECLCLSDFVSEEEGDHLGLFCLSACVGEELGIGDQGGGGEAGGGGGAPDDEYMHVMIKALEDRLVEAAAERMHVDVRADWYDASAKGASLEALLREEYTGIRPAVGYPSLPDHRVLSVLWDALSMPKRPHLGIKLTESYAVDPEAAVCGVILSHEKAHYFSVGRVSAEQVADYACRRGEEADEARQWLTTVLF